MKRDMQLITVANDNQEIKKTRRTLLLDTAESVFLEQGYEACTVNDILIAADLSKGGFYHYFKSKTDLLDALRRRYTDNFIAEIETHVSAVNDDMEKKFHLWIDTYIEIYLSTYTVHDLVYHSVHTSRASEDRLAIIQSLEQLLKQGVANKTWQLSSPNLVATVIYSAIHGVADDAIERQSGDLRQSKKELYSLLRLLLQ